MRHVENRFPVEAEIVIKAKRENRPASDCKERLPRVRKADLEVKLIARL